MKMIVHGFYWTPKSYLKDGFNVLDFIIVCFGILTWILESAIQTDISFIRGFRALRALRPLRMVSKNEGIKTVVNSLLESIPALMNVMLIVLLFLLVFGILGIQLFKGQLGTCNDTSPEIVYKNNCTGTFYMDNVDVRTGINTPVLTNRTWSVPFNNYDNVENDEDHQPKKRDRSASNENFGLPPLPSLEENRDLNNQNREDLENYKSND